MKKLIHAENNGGKIERWWEHYDNSGNKLLTVESLQDATEIIEANKREYNASHGRHGDLSKVATIPALVIENTAKGCAGVWNTSTAAAYREIVEGKTDRAAMVWRELLNAREFRHFRTRPGFVDARKK
jgi:hypothetical protein